MKKYFAECIGTFVLTLLGCGTAMFLGCNTPAGVVGTAIAFGLTVVAMAYTIGGISGCHINPAITFAVALSGRMKWGEAVGYWIGQVVGAMMFDVTSSEFRREEIAAQAREVIRKNLATVQDIACKLGEHMADTEILLRSIAENYADSPVDEDFLKKYK